MRHILYHSTFKLYRQALLHILKAGKYKLNAVPVLVGLEVDPPAPASCQTVATRLCLGGLSGLLSSSNWTGVAKESGAPSDLQVKSNQWIGAIGNGIANTKLAVPTPVGLASFAVEHLFSALHSAGLPSP
jgi:hypothetical protein